MWPSSSVGRLARLPEATCNVLRLAARVGNTLDVGAAAVALADGRPSSGELPPAVEQGLLSLTQGPGGYRFTHDRVRQAAYRTIPEEDQSALHLRVGQAWLERTPEAALDDVVFDLARQLNLGAAEVADASLRLRAADLNLRAGLRAKRAVAHGAAVAYLSNGIAHVRASGEVHGVLAFTSRSSSSTPPC